MAYDAKDLLLLATVRQLFESEEVFKGLAPEMFDLIIARATRQAVDRMAGGVGAGFEPGDGYEWVRKRYRVDRDFLPVVNGGASGSLGCHLPRIGPGRFLLLPANWARPARHAFAEVSTG